MKFLPIVLALVIPIHLFSMEEDHFVESGDPAAVELALASHPDDPPLMPIGYYPDNSPEPAFIDIGTSIHHLSQSIHNLTINCEASFAALNGRLHDLEIAFAKADITKRPGTRKRTSLYCPAHERQCTIQSAAKLLSHIFQALCKEWSKKDVLNLFRPINNASRECTRCLQQVKSGPTQLLEHMGGFKCLETEGKLSCLPQLAREYFSYYENSSSNVDINSLRTTLLNEAKALLTERYNASRESQSQPVENYTLD